MPENRNLFANCQLTDSDADYLWVNAWIYNGAPGGDVYLGDLDGKHLFRGSVTRLVFNADGSAELVAEGSYVANAPLGGTPVPSSIGLNFWPGNEISFIVSRSGLEEWEEANIAVPAGSVIY